MVGTQIGKEDVHADRFGALCAEFVHDAAIDVPGPIEPELQIGAEFTTAENVDGLIADEDEPEIGRGRSRVESREVRLSSEAHAPVVGDPLDALQKVEAAYFAGSQFEREPECNDGKCDEHGRRPQAAQCGHVESKKPRATFVALGLERLNVSLVNDLL